MVEPIGLVGTGVGVVSLGLQLYAGLKEYLDSYTSRDAQVTKALGYLDRLEQTLKVFQDVIPNFEAEQRLESDNVKSILASCRDEMQQLHRELEKYKTSFPVNTEGKIQEAKKKLRYPLAQGKLEELNTRLSRIMDVLSLAVEGLGLRCLSSIHSHATVQTKSLNEFSAATVQRHHSLVADVKASSTASVTAHAKTHTQLKSLDDGISQIRSEASEQTLKLDIINGLLNELISQVPTNQLPHRRISLEGELVGKLLAKPSLSKDICDALHSSPEEDSGGSQPHYIASHKGQSWASLSCGCRPHKSTRVLSRHWSGFVFKSEAVTKSVHLKTCHRFRSECIEQKQQYGVTYLGLRGLLSTAISVGLSLSRGAGGCSISPTFRYFPVVDVDSSKVFRMMYQVACCFQDQTPLWKQGAFDNVDNPHWESFLHYVVQHIKVQYATGTASPNDIDQYGHTLLDYTAHRLINFPLITFRNMNTAKIILKLYDLGVVSKNQDSLCGWRFWGRPMEPVSIAYDALVATLWRVAPECHDQWQAENVDFLTHRRVLSRFDDAPEALGLDALGACLLYQDEDGLRRTISAQPNLLAEFDSYPLQRAFCEMAVQWPAGLQILLNSTPRDMILGYKDQGVNYQTSLLSLAEKWCYLSNSSEVLESLLGYNYPLPASLAFELLRYGTTDTQLVLIRHLGNWRKKLNQALTSLLPQQHHHIISPDRFMAREAVTRLEEIGLDPYRYFALQRGDYRLGATFSSDGSDPTVFHYVRDPEIGQVAYDAGFRGIDTEYNGRTPFINAANNCNTWRDATTMHNTWRYAAWLINHGADYKRQVRWDNETRLRLSNGVIIPRYTALHLIARDLGHYMGCADEASAFYFNLFLSSTCSDKCDCACSPKGRGCYPLTIYLNFYMASLEDEFNSAYEVSEQMLHNISSTLGVDPIFIADIIRSFTFYRLGIRHTCCATINRYSLDGTINMPDDYGSDFEELRGEDIDRVQHLDRLVAEFIEQYHSDGGPLSDFLTGRWSRRMDTIDEEEERKEWSADGKAAAVSIGIIPEDPAYDDVEEPDDPYGTDYSTEVFFQYQRHQIDIIVNGGRTDYERWIDRRDGLRAFMESRR
ncbi:hypothetical protein SAMD00023353_8400080 [Rosellinia necatrix]|uniref:Fungal N-terminal domain-containing protein n=1 Tax=Rosellinia necatrix TaxID=77044 RepID=A0A1W2TWA2_ROSNE|nr:hypothetical protein SAMD00023353_8400080 [Rosellinia necatrix]